MNKGDLVNAISAKTGCTKKASEESLNAILNYEKNIVGGPSRSCRPFAPGKAETGDCRTGN